MALTTQDANDALQRAINDLGAVCVRTGITETVIGGDGKGDDATSVVRAALYAFQPNHDNWRAWRVTDEIGILALARSEIDPHRVGVLIPGWWSPETQFAVLNINSGYIVKDGVLRGSPLAYQGVTVDLETGELIIANLSNVPNEKIYGRGGEEAPAC